MREGRVGWDWPLRGLERFRVELVELVELTLADVTRQGFSVKTPQFNKIITLELPHAPPVLMNMDIS